MHWPRRPRHLTGLLALLTLGAWLATGAPSAIRAADAPSTDPATGSSPLTFEQHIRPILREHCYDCHGAGRELKGGLDLRLVRLLLSGGESGPAIVRGDGQASFLLERIRRGEMPPRGAPVPTEHVETIARWIDSGAPTARPEPETIEPGLGITPEEREFWAFRPVERTAVDLTRFAPDRRVRSEIDALLLEGAPAHASFSEEADRGTLVRRAYLLLTGLPPTPEELARRIEDPDEEWFERLVDSLLASPRYGERWARGWLDVAGYADSEGSTTSDAPRPWAWKYRDWVLRALATDLPFDRFLVEQLAGDELAGEKSGEWTPTQIDLLTATGFLRMAADGTGSGANTALERERVLTDTLKIVSTSLLGLSVHCAQCHDHRYDPISQSDYYSLRAIFEPALNPGAWLTPDARRVSLATDADRALAAKIEGEAQSLVAARQARLEAYLAEALEQELAKIDEPARSQLRDAYRTPRDSRDAKQRELLELHPSVLRISPGVLYQYLPAAAEDLKQHDERIATVRARKPAEEQLRALVEPPCPAPDAAPVTHIFHRGNHEDPREAVVPAALTITAPEGERAHFAAKDPAITSTGRRLAFARWLTNGRHPLVARVLVNRVWIAHFGRGLVETPGEFGRLGSAPSHPALLDWLASELVHEGWSLKRLHRRIVLSSAWRQSSRSRVASLPDRSGGSTTPSDELTPFTHARRTLLRLEAEALRDRMLFATGELSSRVLGPPVPVVADETGQIVLAVGDEHRRGLYAQARRSQPVAFLEVFDAPVMTTNCERRSVSTSATQSLFLLNSDFVLERAAKLAERAIEEARPLSTAELATAPDIEATPASPWQFGYGGVDELAGASVAFTPLPHWTGSAWQGGAQLPDASLGWVLVNSIGGHPDGAGRASIRRFVAPTAGRLSISGTLRHGSPQGDGVRGRIVASELGLLGDWTVHNSSQDTGASFEVAAGATVDFVVDARGDHGFDSFQWPVDLHLESSGREFRLSSRESFHGPVESVDALPAAARRAWELAFSREPSPDELATAIAFLSRQIRHLVNDPTAVPAGLTAPRQALVHLAHVLLSANEFLYVE